MVKSRDAFRTISEVADWLDTPAHVLRFWESKFTQIKPVKRAGGRRYYRPDDMVLLSGIKALLHDQGMTIKGAQKLMREKGVRQVMALGRDPDLPDGPDGSGEIDGQAVEGVVVDIVPVPVAAPGGPSTWDPNDPWPPAMAPEADADPEPAPESAPDPLPDPPRPEVSLPFLRARAAPPVPVEEPWVPSRPIPDLPDEVVAASPGHLARLHKADRARARANAARIAPLLAQLRALSGRAGASRR